MKTKKKKRAAKKRPRKKKRRPSTFTTKGIPWPEAKPERIVIVLR